MYGALRRSVSGVVREINGLEARLGIDPPVKRPDWGLTPAVQRWYEGADLEELEELGGSTSGDICRVFRMSVQLMRNVRRAVGPDSDLADLLQDAVTALNRDEIDARKQLELG
jgi:superfamily II RNA helicase